MYTTEPASSAVPHGSGTSDAFLVARYRDRRPGTTVAPLPQLIEWFEKNN
jgi:hypothetical protein